MGTEEFFEECKNCIVNELHEQWGILREGNGARYVRSPFPDKEHFIEKYEAETESPEVDIQDIDKYSNADIEKLMSEAINEISEAYEHISQLREEFIGLMDEIYEKYEDTEA